MKRQKNIRYISYFKLSIKLTYSVSVTVSAETGTRAEDSVTVSVSAENRVSVGH